MAGEKVFQLAIARREEDEDLPDVRPDKRRKTTGLPGTRPNTKQKERKPKSEKAIMIVGVDFGTTYSGFATAMAGARYNKDVAVNKSWPNCGGHQEKVPSMISYDMKNPAQPKVTAWGYESKSSEHTYTWFKLGLGQHQKQGNFDDELLYGGLGSIKCPPGMSYADLATDYLSHFYKHMMEKIEMQVGQDTFRVLAFHFVLAVPAAWPDESRRAIQSCAEEAGFSSREEDKISLIAEPEAAALATFNSYYTTLEDGRLFKKDTNVMIVDMGGGTVDLITYTIKELKPFRVAEACVGSGAKCGSSTIDRRFEKLMIDRFGKEYTDKPQKIRGPDGLFMDQFENLKRRFDSTTASDVLPLTMDLDSSEYYDAEDGEVILTSEDVEELFQPVIDNVSGLVKEQAERVKADNQYPISTILLCGGLAESKYIQSQLKAFCQEFVPEAQVIVPPSPWSAICCGAAMRDSGKSFISSRRARRSYGTVLLEPFDKDEHDDKDATEHPELGKMVQKMFWHIKRNEKLLSSQKYRWLKNATLYVGGEFGYKGVIEIYQSDSVTAPTLKSAKGVKRLGHLPVDLSGLNGSSKSKKRATTTWIPESDDEAEEIKVEIGQVIKDFMVVEFVARVGAKTVGLASFEYEPITNGEESEDDENPDYWLHQSLDAE